MQGPQMLLAFIAGTVSFLSPCVIPLLPGYLSFLTGLSSEELSSTKNRKEVLIPALLFVFGFSVVFVGLGASASLIGSFVNENSRLISQIGGVFVILFGVYLLGIIKIPWLYGSKGIDIRKSQKFGKFAGFFMGMGFAAGWTPCVGPILASILMLAANTGSASQGVVLLLLYSFGLAVPFLLLAFMFSTLSPLLKFIAKYSLTINRVAGVFLIILGTLLLLDEFSHLIFWITKYIPVVDLGLPNLISR